MRLADLQLWVLDILNGVSIRPSESPNDWIETTATVVECKTRYSGGGVQPANAPLGPSNPHYSYAIKFSYEVDGRSLSGKFLVSTPDEIGHQFKISYDPLHPNKNSGAGPNTWLIAIILVVVAMLFIGIWVWFTQ